MGWVPGFANDVLISYARVDNETADGDPSRGWISQFHRHLEVALSKKIGRLNTVVIWRDIREIRGNQLFDNTIEEAVDGSAVFLALHSHGYLASEYCRQELAAFYNKARREPAGLAVGDQHRIFNLLLNNIPRAGWPAELGRTSGFPIHDAADPDTDGEPSAIGSEAFVRQVRAIAEAVHCTLDRLREANTAPAAPPPNENRFTVFLADTADTLRVVRKRVLNELSQSPDLEVTSNVPPPFESDAHDERVRKMLGTADLSVHLLDGFPGRDVIDKTEGACYPQRQSELALKHGKSQLIWIPKDLQLDAVEDEGYRQFLDRLENGSREGLAYDFQRELPSAVSRQILAKVDELKARRQTQSTGVPSAALLDTHFKDQLHALELSQYLLEHGVQPYINPQEDDPGRNLEVFTQRLKQVGILILFCGAVADEWVRARLAVALQIAIAEECPLQACGVYVAPPRSSDTPAKIRMPLVPVEWMDHTRGFNPGAVDHLLAKAQQSGGLLAGR